MLTVTGSLAIVPAAHGQTSVGQWFNPIDGSVMDISGLIANTGGYTFTRPSGWEDAVLTLAAVPEPSSLGPLTLGGLAMSLRPRRRD